MRFVIPLKCIPHRILISIEAFIAMAVSYMMQYCTLLALTEMTKPTKNMKDGSCNDTAFSLLNPLEKTYEFSWQASHISYLQMSIFIGQALSTVPSGILADKIGFKIPVIMGLLISGLSTVLHPISARSCGAWGMIIARFILGMAQGLFQPALYTMMAQWIPKHERPILGAIIFSGLYLGNAINYSCSGNILWYFKGKWSILFYLYGSIGIFIGFLFLFTTYNSPEDNPYLKQRDKELFNTYIKSMKSLNPELKRIPWYLITKNNPVWSIVIIGFGHGWCVSLIIIGLPTFVNSVLNYNAQQSGVIIANIHSLIFLATILNGLFWYFVVDKYVPHTANRKLASTFANILPSLGMLLSTYTKCNRITAILLITIGTLFLGSFYPTVKINPMDITPNFAGTVGAMAHCSGALSGIFVTSSITQLTINNSMEEWRIVFWLFFIIMLLTNMNYILFASADIQNFNMLKSLYSRIFRDNVLDSSDNISDSTDQQDPERKIPSGENFHR